MTRAVPLNLIARLALRLAVGLLAAWFIAACGVEFTPSVAPLDVESPPAEAPLAAPGELVPGLGVRYEEASDFSAERQGWIRQALDNWGALIGADRFSELVAQGAAADGNNEYAIRYSAEGGAGHLDQEGVVVLGEDVFAEDNWQRRYRPDPLYQNSEASSRISVGHEFAHVIFNGDRAPVDAFEGIFDPTDPAHQAVSVNTNAEEALANILALMAEQGPDAPGIPEDLRACVVGSILPYLAGDVAEVAPCAPGP